jgi:hypothetical protein
LRRRKRARLLRILGLEGKLQVFAALYDNCATRRHLEPEPRQVGQRLGDDHAALVAKMFQALVLRVWSSQAGDSLRNRPGPSPALVVTGVLGPGAQHP